MRKIYLENAIATAEYTSEVVEGAVSQSKMFFSCVERKSKSETYKRTIVVPKKPPRKVPSSFVNVRDN